MLAEPHKSVLQLRLANLAKLSAQHFRQMGLRHAEQVGVVSSAEVDVGRLPRQQVVRHGPPLVATAHDVENHVHNLPPAPLRWAAAGFDGGHQRLKQLLFPLTKIAGIGLAPRYGVFQRPVYHQQTPFETVSNIPYDQDTFAWAAHEMHDEPTAELFV